MFFNIILNRASLVCYRHARTFLTANIERKYIIVKNKTNVMKFPQIWLRDNCRCEKCFHKNTTSRIYEFQINVCATKVTSVANNAIQVDWDDFHTSTFDLNWLQHRAFDEKCKKDYIETFYKCKRSLWSKRCFRNHCLELDFEEVITDKGLQKWIEAVATSGVAIINKAPSTTSLLREFTDLVGFVRKTHYGELWMVEAKQNAENYAYLSSSLPLHSDLPYYEYQPGLNLLHCLKQTKSSGGQSLIADGFYIADRLRKEDLKSFLLLKRIPVNWNDIGRDSNGNGFQSIYRSPVINLDSEGQCSRINLSVPQRDSHFSVALKDVIPWYQAFWEFIAKVKQETFSFKLREGQILTFDNQRILHGRTQYDDKISHARQICGAYLDWDIVNARWRYLKHVNQK